jgi:hypothetical protein
MSLKLIINNLNLEIINFLSPRFPRMRLRETSAKLEYSGAGTSIGNGPCFYPKHQWQVNCLITPDEQDLLEAIYAEFEQQRQDLGSADIVICDTNDFFRERSPRTRAIVPDTSERLIQTGYIAYFAQFKGWFVIPPVYEEDGIYILADFTLQETDKLTDGDEGNGDGGSNNSGGNSTGDKHFTHTQLIASTTWIINHNLNKFPSVRLVNNTGREMKGGIVDIDENNLQINFNIPVSGKAYLN